MARDFVGRAHAKLLLLMTPTIARNVEKLQGGNVPRGGNRQGKIGTAYKNRSDLNNPKIPTITPVGAPYGARQALVSQQQALPVAPAGTAVPQAQPPAPVGQPPPQPQGPPPDFHRPTERPSEPVTHGLPVGAGGGPEVLGAMAPVNRLGDLLNMIASSPSASPDVQALAAWTRSQPR